ncbi:MAG: hypothetical protein OSA89_03060 [Mariniblastus sp.]|nr:hypothetical protein [Mariniblastus sp.]
MTDIARPSLLLITCLAISLTMPMGCFGDDFLPESFTNTQFAEYERKLNALLKTRADEEKKFVNQIVMQVKLGKIPSRLVSTSYQWGRTKRPNTNYPFIYFEKVIRIQAKAMKLEKEIPAFDYSIYKSDGQSKSGSKSAANQDATTKRSLFKLRPNNR